MLTAFICRRLNTSFLQNLFVADVNECVNSAFRRRRSLSETKGTEAENDSARQKRNVYYSVAAVSPSPVIQWVTVSTTSATPGKIYL